MIYSIWYGPYDMVKLIWCLGSSPRCIQIHINCMANQMIWFRCRRYNSSTNVLALFSESMRHPHCYATYFIWNFSVLNSINSERKKSQSFRNIIHVIHIRNEFFVDLDCEPIISLDMSIFINNQPTVWCTSLDTTFSWIWTTTKIGFIMTRALVCVVLTLFHSFDLGYA